MNFTPLASKVSFLLLMIIGSSLTTFAKPSDYPDINEELGQLLVRNMGSLMNDYSPNNPDYPTFSDEHYRARFMEMSGAIQYRLTTDIKNHIIHRTERYRSATERTLGLSEIYFPIFEEYLAEKDIPHHIKYLPIVESNLNGVARSHAAAVGLWQFIPGTAKMYGLTVSSHLDERSDTHKASHAAATMLSNLFKRYGDWPLALAAYNCGPGRVDRYVKGTDKDFWDIRALLPRETQMYVPYFMAVAYSYEFHHLHELTAKKQHTDFVLTDSIHLEPGYKTLAQLSKYYNIDKDTLKRLNPGYIKNYIPSTGDHILVLPARIVAKFRNYEPAYNRIMEMRTENPIKCIRRVNNEYELRKLMKAHRFSREDVMFWNGLPSNYSIKKGDLIAIRKYHVPKDAWAKQFTPPTIEGISIASLKVVSLDDEQKRAVTAPVYTTLNKKKKLANQTTTPALVATNTKKRTNTKNPYQLSNKTTAVSAQRAKQPSVMDQVSQDRTRQRRLRTPAKAAPSDPVVIATTPTPTAPVATTTPAPADNTAALAAKQQKEQQVALQEVKEQSTKLYQKERAATKATVFTTTTKEEKQALAYLEAQSKKLVEKESQIALANQQAEAAKLLAAQQAAAKQAEEAKLLAAQQAAAAKQAEEAKLLAAQQAAAAKQAEEAKLLAAQQAAAAKQAEEAKLLAAQQAAAAKQAEEAKLLAAQQAAAKQAEEAKLLAAQQAAAAKQVEEAKLLAAQQAAAAKQAEDAKLLAAQQAAAAKQVEEAKLLAAQQAAAAKQAEEAKLLAAQQAAAAKQAEEAKLLAAQQAEAAKQVQIQETAPLNTTNYEYYTVQKNETIWTIQRRYPRAASRDILLLNDLTSRSILHEGMQLKIPVQ